MKTIMLLASTAIFHTSGGNSDLGNLLIQLVVGGLIFFVLWWALGAINPPEPFKKVITVILVLVACIWLINILLGLSGHTLFG